MYNDDKNNNPIGGYPKPDSPKFRIEGHTLDPADHLIITRQTEHGVDYNHIKFLIDDQQKHFTRDVNSETDKNRPVAYPDKDGNMIPVFSGSTTHINPLNNPLKQDIIDNGLEASETEHIQKKTDSHTKLPPLSPIHPFTRTDPYMAQLANLTTYNRAKLPIVDLEFRKGFRHVFISRPECYVMAHNPNGLKPCLSKQCAYDEDFTSCASRMPFILNLLSPIYVTGSYSQNAINSNWNYLLTNRVKSIQLNVNSTLTYSDNISKSIKGYTVTSGMNNESRVGSTINISFRDTKNLEVYEFLRMWILYIDKIHDGVFSPSYNGYQYENGFITADENGTPVNGSIINHPYDSALDYCASLFDFITNESGVKILHWCKYYGIYPTEVSVEGLSSENNAPLTSEVTVTAVFKYQYKLDNVNKTLVEFNYNSGITDDLGRVNKEVLNTSYPFLLRDNPEEVIMKQYIGASGMFTGSPYVILGKCQNDPLDGEGSIITPYLQFLNIENETLNDVMNVDITNVRTESGSDAIGVKQ